MLPAQILCYLQHWFCSNLPYRTVTRMNMIGIELHAVRNTVRRSLQSLCLFPAMAINPINMGVSLHEVNVEMEDTLV